MQPNPLIREVIPVRAKALNVVDGAPGFGFAPVGGFPQGNILFLGAVAYLRFTTASANIIAAFDGDFSIGTTGTVDNDVADAGEANIIPSTPLNPATAKVSPYVRGVSSAALNGVILDNTDGSLLLNLNLLIDDTSISGAAAFTVDGVVRLAYIVMGDD
jgi:hypothetical protein